MKILITGVAGFIGCNFAKYLLKKKNYKIIGIDNLNSYYSPKIKKERLKELRKYKNFNFYKLDIKYIKNLDSIFKRKIDVIFHFAAQAGVRYSLINPRSYIESNTLGFFNLIESAKKNKISKFFYASSSSVYGDSDKFPVKENDKINPKNMYGLTKKNNEEIAEIFLKNSKIRAVGLRFFTVFGEWGRPDMLIYKYLESIFNKKKNFYLNNYGNHTRDFTYIKDVCEILHKLLHRKNKFNHQVFNICSNKPIKITSVLKIIDSYFNKKPKIIKREFQLADVKKTHGSNNKIKKFVRKKKFFNIKKALNSTSNWYNDNWKIFS
tara:strand:- start:1206 stop:2171 length:966 start_codon:yes stop_codon:yes gene_type:complete